MGVFEFILILVLITTLGKVGVAVLRPLADHGGDLLKEMAAERRASRLAGASPPSDTVVAELESRLSRIEDRLDFLEELRAPAGRPELGRGRSGAGPGGS